MADMLNFELVSPERKLASVEAEAVTIPGMMGDLTDAIFEQDARSNVSSQRQNLQMEYVGRLAKMVDGGYDTPSQSMAGVARYTSGTAALIDSRPMGCSLWTTSRPSEAEPRSLPR